MIFNNKYVLLGRGRCTGACLINGLIEYYLAENNYVKAYVYRMGEKAVDGEGVIVSYGQSFSRSKNLSATVTGGKLAIENVT